MVKLKKKSNGEQFFYDAKCSESSKMHNSNESRFIIFLMQKDPLMRFIFPNNVLIMIFSIYFAGKRRNVATHLVGSLELFLVLTILMCKIF